MNKRFRADVEKNLFRVPISLDKGTHDWLYNLGISMKMNGGYKLPKSYIIRGLINAFVRLKINFKNTKTEADLEMRILQSLRGFKKPTESTTSKQMENPNRNLIIANIGMNKRQEITAALLFSRERYLIKQL